MMWIKQGLSSVSRIATQLLLSLYLACSFAHAAPELTDADGRRLEISISDQFPSAQTQEIVQWIESVSTSLAGVYGHWPRKHWRIKVENTSGASDDPIPWAQVRRGKVDEVEFFVVEPVNAEVLTREWTSYHELAHLLIPYRGWGDAWFSEGLASYYQNLLQARSGVIGEQQMWQKLYEGFMRGRADSRFDGDTLGVVSADLRENGGFMRVYWSGAWYFLSADLALRSQSAGRVSLDSALEKLNDCCADRSMSVLAMVHALDDLNRVDIFTNLYHETLKSTSQPAFEPLFAALGIAVKDGQVILGADSEAGLLRHRISAAPAL